MLKRLFYLIIFTSLQPYLTGCGNKTEEKDNYLSDTESVQHGQELFTQYCASCHDFETTQIGPNLSGVTSQESKEWLVSFIKNAPELIERGDERATQLYEEFKQPMPAFMMLQENEIETLLAYINTHQETAKEKGKRNLADGMEDPIPEKIPASGLSLVLEKVLTVPASAEETPLARINKLLAIEGTQDNRLFIHDLRGKLYEIKGKKTQVYLDLPAEMPKFIEQPGLGTGFGSFDFHPDFENNGLLYTTHTEPKNTAPADFAIPDSIPVALQWVLTEWKTNDPKAEKFTGTHRELLRADMYSGIHGCQELTFNPLAKPGDSDYGMLYLCTGDGGSGFSPYSFLCHDKGKIWGTVSRIDPAGNNSKNGNYGIPADNPFVDEPGALGEIWAYGFRNPHRISWDLTGSGKMYISNIGQHGLETVNLGAPGADFGWPEREGTFIIDNSIEDFLVFPIPENDPYKYTYPVVQYDHDEGIAISGGFVYAGSEVPALKGKYFFGDITPGRIFYTENQEIEQGHQAQIYEVGIQVDGKETTLRTITGKNRVDLRFGLDGKGELYIFTKADGVLWKVVGAEKTANTSPAG